MIWNNQRSFPLLFWLRSRAEIRPLRLGFCLPQVTFFNRNWIFTTSVAAAGGKWRRSKGLPTNYNAYGLLTDLPDYTYLDGHQTPLGAGQKKRVLKQRAYAEKVKEIMGEINFAVDRFNRIKFKEEEKKQNILNDKLKQKSENLLQTQGENEK